MTFGYAADRPLFSELDLELAPGRTVALIGHTGSGKTSLASLIPRFYDVQAGRVTIDGADVRDADAELAATRDRRDRAGPVPLLGDRAREPRVRPARGDRRGDRGGRRLAQAHEFIERLPEGYDTVIGERGITLSGGQRQRVAIARALVVDPRILILDDATASVDATTEAKIRLGLQEAMKGRTTVIIAHRLSTIALADEIVVLDHGRIVAAARTTTWSASSEVYREIWEHGRAGARAPSRSRRRRPHEGLAARVDARRPAGPERPRLVVGA